MAGWIKFDDAYQCHVSDMIEYRKKHHWPVRCPDCKEWVQEPVFASFDGWTPYSNDWVMTPERAKRYYLEVSHFFKECECGAQLTVFTK